MKQHEEDMANINTIVDELEVLMYKIGDCEVKPTEDQLLNMIIGMIELHRVRYEKMWSSWSKEITCKKNDT